MATKITVTADDGDLNIRGSGFKSHGPYVRVELSYQNMLELYKAGVAGDDDTDHESGEIDLSVPYRGGSVDIRVTNWPMTSVLAKARHGG